MPRGAGLGIDSGILVRWCVSVHVKEEINVYRSQSSKLGLVAAVIYTETLLILSR